MAHWDLVLSTCQIVRFIGSYKGHYTALLALGDRIPNQERLFLGGIKTIRGFRSLSIYPEKADEAIKGGMQSLYNNVEVSVPLGTSNFRLSFFVDYGLIGNEQLNSVEKGSYGVSLQMITPMGPLAFIFPRPLINAHDHEVSSFEFAIGNLF